MMLLFSLINEGKTVQNAQKRQARTNSRQVMVDKNFIHNKQPSFQSLTLRTLYIKYKVKTIVSLPEL